MLRTRDLYRITSKKDIPIITLPIPKTGSMCIKTEHRCYIGIDDSVLVREDDRRVHLAHELGHCETGAFYNIHSPQDLRQKQENKADKWAIKKLVPKDELNKAVSRGLTESWELAEYFDVTEEFMRKAICWHKHGSLDTAQYFPA